MRISHTLTLLLTLTTVTMTPSLSGETIAAKQIAQDFTSAAKKAIPAVVSIKTQFKDKKFGDDEFFSNFDDDFWSRFFGLPNRDKKGQNAPLIGQGSGFLVSPDGYILTNNHIVQDSAKLVVTLNDGREFNAKVIGQDANTDIAVIKIDAKNLPFLKLGNSTDLEVGQWAVAIGNPLGLQATLTVGVISAKDRSNLGLAPYEDYIQTDAAINLGNSGGPLLNLDGEVIGINTAIATKTGGYMGIGFAIPSSMAQHVMDQLIADGSVTRGYLGIALQQMTPDLAEAFGLENTRGVVIAEVEENSAAAKAGIKRGDIILKYNGKDIDALVPFRNAVAMMKPDSPLTLTIKRGKETLDLKMTIGKYPDQTTASTSDSKKSNKLGLQVEEMTSELAQSLGYTDEKGVVITKVEPGSLAAWAGFRKGGVILSINQQQVTKPDQFYQAVNNTPTGQPILLLIKEGKRTQFISLKAE